MNSRPRSSLPRPVGRRLREIVGSRGLILKPDRLLAYESDALTQLRGAPLAAVFPTSTTQLRESVACLHEAGIPFVPRGAGTGLAGGAVARREVLVCTTRMNRILELIPEDRLARAQPGVQTGALTEAAAPHGLRYLPDPASAAACTIGGNVAQNAGGPHCLKHGVTTDHVLELLVVLPDGTPRCFGRGEDGGLDLAGLFVGSEGTLGIAAEITVRLFPRAPAVRTALILFDRLADAGRAVSEILAAGYLPVALELIDRATIRIVEGSPYAAGLPTDVAAALVVEFEGEEEGTEADLLGAAEAARRCGARELRIARDEAERERVWRARKRAYGALGRRAPEVMIQDAAVPRTALTALLPRIQAIAKRHGVEVCNFFHAGDGNLHPNLPLDRRDPELVKRVERANREILALCVEAGGTITGEHGVGLDKREAMRLIFSPAELSALRAVKEALDPRGLCNAGKVIPSETAAAPR
ncbi:MAG: FAD-binding oxidoreductase [Gemmatimonadota bacterium]